MIIITFIDESACKLSFNDIDREFNFKNLWGWFMRHDKQRLFKIYTDNGEKIIKTCDIKNIEVII